MKPYKSLDLLPYLLTGYFAVLLVQAIRLYGRFDFWAGSIFLLLACSLGLIVRRPGVVKAIVWAGLLGGIAGMFQLFQDGLPGKAFLSGYIFLSFFLAALFRIPYVREHFGPAAGAKKASRILLIDDDQSLLKLLSTNFKKQGYFVHAAETGEKGLLLARQFHPDLILLDVILPGLKGRTVCSRLKEDPQTKDIPVLFLTAKDSPDDIQAEIAAGAVGHITKPVDFRKLSEEVMKILKVKREE